MAFDIKVDAAIREGRAFTTTTDLFTITTNQEYPVLLLRNPSASGMLIETTHFLFGTNASSVRTVFRAYASPNVTAVGNALTIANTLVDPTAPSSGVECYREPTVSANGSRLNMAINPANAPSRGINRFYYMVPGAELLVTLENSSSNVSSFADIYWIERT